MARFKKISNEAVKQPNMVIEYTENQLSDLMECINDPLFFTKKYVRIQHSTKGSLPFLLYPYQEEIIRTYHENRYSIVLAARQLGKTACTAAFLLWRAMFIPDSTILITANLFAQAIEIMDRIKYAYENMPDFIRAGVKVYNKKTVEFDNGSKIVCRATTPNAGRGLSISLLYVDELAFVPPRMQKEFWTSITPVLSTGGSAIVTSTPKNDEDIFAQIWKGAMDRVDEFGNPRPGKAGKNDYVGVLFKWDVHPDRDQDWEKSQRQQLGDSRFEQEMNCSFVTDDETLISALRLVRMHGQAPIGYSGQVRWYSDPQPNHAYLVALDPSLGTGGDDAAIQVFELPGMRQVAEWQHNRTQAKGQVRVLREILQLIDSELGNDPNQYGEPEIYWTFENNSIGEAVLQVIADTGEDKFPGTLLNEKRRPGQSFRRLRKGLNTNNTKKVSACLRFKSLLESDRATICSEQLIRQLKTYVRKGPGFEAKSTVDHDDLVSAALLCFRMIELAQLQGVEVGDVTDDVDSEDDNAPMPTMV